MATATNLIAEPVSSDRMLLTAAHRCDASSCGAQARAVAILPSNNILLFCRHHAEKNTPGLVGAGAQIDTQYDSL